MTGVQTCALPILLKTSVSDLIEPDMSSFVVGYLHDWLGKEATAARGYQGLNDKDARKVMGRMLNRIAEQLMLSD